MEKANILFWRNFLYRVFFIGLLFAILIGIGTFGFWDKWTVIANNRTGLGATEFAEIIVSFYANLRFFLVFIVLTPALALHWMLKNAK